VELEAARSDRPEFYLPYAIGKPRVKKDIDLCRRRLVAQPGNDTADPLSAAARAPWFPA